MTTSKARSAGIPLGHRTAREAISASGAAQAEQDRQAERRPGSQGERIGDRGHRTGAEDDEARGRRADVVAEGAVHNEERDEPAKGARPEAAHEAPADEPGAAAVAETRRDVEGWRADRRGPHRETPQSRVRG